MWLAWLPVTGLMDVIGSGTRSFWTKFYVCRAAWTTSKRCCKVAVWLNFTNIQQLNSAAPTPPPPEGSLMNSHSRMTNDHSLVGTDSYALPAPGGGGNCINWQKEAIIWKMKAHIHKGGRPPDVLVSSLRVLSRTSWWLWYCTIYFTASVPNSLPVFILELALALALLRTVWPSSKSLLDKLPALLNLNTSFVAPTCYSRVQNVLT